MPAMRATLNTSPLRVPCPSRRISHGRGFEKWTRPVAVAWRWVTGFSLIWVMWTFWEGVRWGRYRSDAVGRAALLSSL